MVSTVVVVMANVLLLLSQQDVAFRVRRHQKSIRSIVFLSGHVCWIQIQTLARVLLFKRMFKIILEVRIKFERSWFRSIFCFRILQEPEWYV